MTIRHDEAPAHVRAPSAAIADFLRGSISVRHLAGLAWSGRLIIATTTVIGLLWGGYSAHRNGPLFAAVMKISPAETDSLGGGSSSAATSMLADLTGSAAAGVTVPKFIQFQAAMGSMAV